MSRSDAMKMPDEDERSEKRNGNAGKPMPGEDFLREP
jgi:hypothetical protein